MRDTIRNLNSITDVVFWRDGGQRQARRNAWAAMVADAQRARERADAAAAAEQVSASILASWPAHRRTPLATPNAPVASVRCEPSGR
jgi:hypothetical protein